MEYTKLEKEEIYFWAGFISGAGSFTFSKNNTLNYDYNKPVFFLTQNIKNYEMIKGLNLLLGGIGTVTTDIKRDLCSVSIYGPESCKLLYNTFFDRLKGFRKDRVSVWYDKFKDVGTFVDMDTASRINMKDKILVIIKEENDEIKDTTLCYRLRKEYDKYLNKDTIEKVLNVLKDEKKIRERIILGRFKFYKVY